MDTRDLFPNQHAAKHSVAVSGNKMSAAERAFTGPTDEQMRVRPREDLNSLAWRMWHSAGHMGEATTVRTAGGFGTGI